MRRAGSPVLETSSARNSHEQGAETERRDWVGSRNRRPNGFEWSASSGVSLPRISWRGLAGTLAVLAIIDRRRIRGAAGKTIRTRWSPV